MSDIKQLFVALQQARAKAREEWTPENRAAIKPAERALSEAISAGAEPCPKCKNLPHGMVQCFALKRRPVTGITIGCLVCKNEWAEGLVREEVVERWNAGERDSPRE